MLKRKFIFAVSVLAILAVGNAYATDPADTSSTTDTVGTEHTVYGSTTLSGATNYATSGIAGVTYVNRMVNVAGNAAQAAESHAAAAGASALSAASAAAAAQTAANNAQTTANGVANKLDKTSTVKKAIVTTDKDGKLAPVVIADTGNGTYITGVTVSDAGAVTLTRGTPTAYSLPVATSTKLGGVKAGGANITIASDGTISATDTKYSAGSNISLSGTTFNVPTANGTNLGVVKQGSNITIASDGTISATDMRYTLPTASSSTKGGVKIGSGVSVTSDGTISVAAPGNATLTIQRNGTSVGTFTANASSNKTIDITDSDTTYSAGTNISLDGTTFNVPTANGTNLGVVKQGSNITIASDGTISATDMRYTLPTASSSTKGGVKIGSGVSVTSDGTISVAAPGNATLTIQRNGTDVGTFTANASSNKTINITDNDTTYAAGKNVTITDGNKINAIPVNSTTESDTLTDVFPSVSMMRAEMDDLAGDLNADVADLQETSVKHGKNTAVGTTTTPVYVTSDGTATVVTGIDSSLLPAAKSDALGGVKTGTNITNNSGTISVATANGNTLGVVKAGTNVSISSGAVSVANATATTKGVAMLGVIPAGADKSGTATIWVE